MKFRKIALLFFGGAAGYSCLELLWRGYTHWSMALTGGLCLVGMYGLHRLLYSRPLWVQALAGTAMVTAIEFAVGCIVNLLLGWKVWDYSTYRIQLLGQICLVFSCLWYLLNFLVFTSFTVSDYFHEKRT